MNARIVGAWFSGIASLAACATAAPYASREDASPAATTAPSPVNRRVDWNQAIALLKAGRVRAIVQTHDLSVTLTLAEGASVITQEPAIDAILAAISMYAPNPQAIVVATE